MQSKARRDLFGLVPDASDFSPAAGPELLLHDFHDAAGVDPHRLVFPKVEEHVAILRRTKVVAILKRILRAIGEPNRKRPERTPLNQVLDIRCLHGR
jgi:hypothetical protein